MSYAAFGNGAPQMAVDPELMQSILMRQRAAQQPVVADIIPQSQIVEGDQLVVEEEKSSMPTWVYVAGGAAVLGVAYFLMR